MLNYRGFNIDNYSSYTKDELNTLFEKTNSKISVSDVVGPLDILVEKKNENNETEQLFIKYRLDKFKKTKSQEQQILDIYTNIIKKNTVASPERIPLAPSEILDALIKPRIINKVTI